ncbi:MAG TPA: UDP-N-acetylglucosamine 1-carboxyvinyltransferase [Acidothermaceae bacterium]|jgi:UDP-N-acetylglucosamine 1-carboxyvinyltransferase
MERIRVAGSARLAGDVVVTGAKNSVLKLMAAALLAPGRTTISAVPGILDVDFMSELLRRLGCAVESTPGRLVIDVPDQIRHEADYDLVRRLRASIAVLGPLLVRCGEARVALPGGDNIGSRGLDLHVAGLQKLGAELDSEHGFLIARAPHGLVGTTVWLDFPSVGATENLMMAGVLARGTTVIDNAAREPEIVDLARMLQGMGAKVDGAGSSTIEIQGVTSLSPTEHATVPDRIVAGTFAIAAVMTQGEIAIRGARPEHLEIVLDRLVGCGAAVSELDDGFHIEMNGRPSAVDVVTLPYPGFPTDFLPMIIGMNAVADGAAMVTENVFEGRFRFIQELVRLGADVRTDGHHAVIRGRERLSGAPVAATDIRAGAALVLAGLVADGVTTVSELHHVDRGYAGFVEQLQALGADVVREPDPDSASFAPSQPWA